MEMATKVSNCDEGDVNGDNGSGQAVVTRVEGKG